jgi:hypothetical protein
LAGGNTMFPGETRHERLLCITGRFLTNYHCSCRHL